jgi:hypothetical protein
MIISLFMDRTPAIGGHARARRARRRRHAQQHTENLCLRERIDGQRQPCRYVVHGQWL